MKSESESQVLRPLNGRSIKRGFSSSDEDSSCFIVPFNLLAAASASDGGTVLLQTLDTWLQRLREASEFRLLLRRFLLLFII